MKKLIQFSILGVVLALVGCQSLYDRMDSNDAPAESAAKK
jgi:hypothetical protein